MKADEEVTAGDVFLDWLNELGAVSAMTGLTAFIWAILIFTAKWVSDFIGV